jgi:hypothetical protein
MARTSIKSTYALDPETVHKLERVAAEWHVSKSEVLRRAIDLVAEGQTSGTLSPLQALDELQRSLKLTPRQVERWALESRRERTRTSARHEWRKR